jgi:hypothetical protein
VAVAYGRSSTVAKATAANGTSPTRITGGGLLLIWCFLFKGGSVPPAPTAPNWVHIAPPFSTPITLADGFSSSERG